MLLRRTAISSTLPLTTAQAKEHLRVTHDLEDDLIAAILSAAVAAVGEMSGRALVEETWVAAMDYVPQVFELPKSPLKAVTSVTYYDATDTLQTATLSDYYVYQGDDRSYMQPKMGKSWPTATPNRADAILITFTAGYTSVPHELRMAILLMVAHLYANREAVGGKMDAIPYGVESLVGLHKIGWAAA